MSTYVCNQHQQKQTAPPPPRLDEAAVGALVVPRVTRRGDTLWVALLVYSY